jgi:hypothetical protein
LAALTFIAVREEQVWNAETPMVVTLLGMATDVREEQPANAAVPMVVTLVPMVTVAREVQ